MRINSTEPSCTNWICDAVGHAARRHSVCCGGAVSKKTKQNNLCRGPPLFVSDPQRQGVCLSAVTWVGYVSGVHDQTFGLRMQPVRSLMHPRVPLHARWGSGGRSGSKARTAAESGWPSIPTLRRKCSVYFSGTSCGTAAFTVFRRFGRKYKSEERLLQAFWKTTEKEEATTNYKLRLLLKRLAWMAH